MEYLKELAAQIGGKIKLQENSNMNFKEKSLQSLIVSNYRDFRIQINKYGNIHSLSIKVESDFALSINNPDKIFAFNEQIYIENVPYKVYASSKDYKPVTNKFRENFWKDFGGKIEKLKLSQEESVFFYNNSITFGFLFSRKLHPIIDDIISLIDSHSNIFGKERVDVSIKDVPIKFRPLIKLIEEWSISDDVEREQKVTKASINDKIKLINAVEPLMSDINNYLDSFKDHPLSESAVLLGNLAELVTELKINNGH